jgi:hypothetical protein
MVQMGLLQRHEQSPGGRSLAERRACGGRLAHGRTAEKLEEAVALEQPDRLHAGAVQGLVRDAERPGVAAAARAPSKHQAQPRDLDFIVG